jgi:hypothetical protein
MQVFRSTFLSLAPNAAESLHTRSAVGFLGKAGGLGGAPLSEGDMHRLARDEVFFLKRKRKEKSEREKLHAAIEGAFSDPEASCIRSLRS